jgi:hypothetical protein
VDQDLIEKLRADKREIQEKIDTLTKYLQDYETQGEWLQC